MNLLLVEDDLKLVDLLGQNLKDLGYELDTAVNAEELLNFINSERRFDLVILDRLLQSTDTKELLPQIKQKWAKAPVLILSAISTPNERTDLINKGADDYLGKPFSTDELMARINALLRRSGNSTSTQIEIGNVVIDAITRAVTVSGRSLALPAKEFLLLHTLAQDCKKIWSRSDLLDKVWGHTSELETNVVESTITNLRKRLSDLNAGITIRNMRNAGYWIET